MWLVSGDCLARFRRCRRRLSGGNAVGVIRVGDVLNDGVARAGNHVLTPRCHEPECAVLFRHNDEPHRHALGPIGRPPVRIRCSEGTFVTLWKRRGGDEDFFVPRFRAPVANDHVAFLRGWALGFFALAFDDGDDDFAGFGWAHAGRAWSCARSFRQMSPAPAGSRPRCRSGRRRGSFGRRRSAGIRQR